MNPATLTQAETDVLAERAKQRAKWGNDHDDKHKDGVLATAAMALAGNLDPGGEGWIVDLVRKHADNPRRRLVITAAFAIAEIERLDRAGGE